MLENNIIDLFCIASGPSLTSDDCKLIENSGIKTVAVNNSWEMAKFCDYIYAGDTKWWNEYCDKINIDAEKWTCSIEAANKYKINYHIASGSYNSGMRAIQFGVFKGFKRIALIGYDCSLKNGIHWHGRHISNLRNPEDHKVRIWNKQFQRVADNIKNLNVKVINCSRYTELKCFECVVLEKVLGINNE